MANYTAAQVESLRKAIASGVLTVEHLGTRTTYRTLDEMRRILKEMEGDVSGTPRVRRTRAVYDGGTSDG